MNVIESLLPRLRVYEYIYKKFNIKFIRFMGQASFRTFDKSGEGSALLCKDGDNYTRVILISNNKLDLIMKGIETYE